MPETRREDEPITAINVTPLVDITLVLVIIFMITMPFLTERALPVKASDEKVVAVSSLQEPILVEITKQGELRVENQSIAGDQLVQDLQEIIKKRGMANVAVSADRSVSHGQVVTVLDEVMQAGAENLDLLEPEGTHGRL